MHVLVTGGAGFIGSHLAEWHLGRGDRVHVVDDLSTGKRENLAWAANEPGLRFDQADLWRWEGMEAACQWADRIYHMAAITGVKRVLKEPARIIAVNTQTTDFLLQAIQQTDWRPEIVIASSSEVYGRTPRDECGEEDAILLNSRCKPRWNYAVSKFGAELLASLYVSRFKHRIVVARIFSSIGPRQIAAHGAVLPTFVRQAVAGDDIAVHGDGTQTRFFCDVRDTVEFLTRLAGTPAAHGKVVNVGSAQEIEIRALAELVRERAQSRSKITFVPYAEAYGEEFEELPCQRPALTLLEKLTDYRPRRSLTEIIDELIAIERKRAADLYRAAAR